jgi:membrane protease YdiL (CAAX protease family)
MSNLPPSSAPALPLQAKLMNHPLTRIVTASLGVIVPIALTLMVIQLSLDKSMRHAWPQLLCTVLCIAAFRLYVLKFEKREMSELSLVGALREFALGAAIGTAAFLVVVGILWGSGALQVDGINHWRMLLSSVAELILVAFFEEILFRGILLRILESWIGRMPALWVSACLFALAHLPNEGISLLGIAVTIVAGLMFGVAFLVTRRLWLPIGIHFFWNFMSDGVFSLATSGHPANGLLQAHLSGPEWLSGGAYGVEASLVTLLVISVTTLWLAKFPRVQPS